VDRVLQQRCVFARHLFVNLQVALRLLIETRGNLGTQNKRYENHWSDSPAFSSLTKREFHASHPEEAVGDDTASVQPEENFREGGDCRKRQSATSLTDPSRRMHVVSPRDLPVNQRFHLLRAMSFIAVATFVSLEIAVRSLPDGEVLHFSALRFCVVAIPGIVLAITLHMHCLVPTMKDRANQPGGFKYASAQHDFRHARPGVAAKDLQGGRWTKDWCGGDQQWRARLSGREWTDRRRSG
jgi:hypothetical protein